MNEVCGEEGRGGEEGKRGGEAKRCAMGAGSGDHLSV